MSRTFWFLALFVAWCLACTLWYMFLIKGISTDINYFQPQARLIAIFEILIIILIACLIGLGMGWTLRDSNISNQLRTIIKLQKENRSFAKIKSRQADELKKAEQKLVELESQLSDLITQGRSSTSLLKQDLTEIGQQLSETRKEKSDLIHKMEELNQQIIQQQSSLDEKERIIEKLKSNTESNQKSKKEILTPHPFVRPPENSERDDLTKIKGIGPFIEKRLNMIGIYTFKQLSELNSDMINHLGPAIEFFPHRIIKDDWVGQAATRIKR